MQPTQIEYAPVTAEQTRRRIVRRILIGLVLLFAAAGAIRIGPLAWHRVQLLYWQHRALTYSAPADQVVFDDDSSRAAALRRDDPSLTIGTDGTTVRFAKPWERFYELLSPPGAWPAGTLFLHERKNSKGERRLVVIIEAPTCVTKLAGNEYVELGLQRKVFKPGDLFSEPHEESCMLQPTALRLRGTKWYAGQPDPKDESHFTIAGMFQGAPTRIEGWLRDDGELELRESP